MTDFCVKTSCFCHKVTKAQRREGRELYTPLHFLTGIYRIVKRMTRINVAQGRKQTGLRERARKLRFLHKVVISHRMTSSTIGGFAEQDGALPQKVIR